MAVVAAVGEAPSEAVVAAVAAVGEAALGEAAGGKGLNPRIRRADGGKALRGVVTAAAAAGAVGSGGRGCGVRLGHGGSACMDHAWIFECTINGG